MSNPLEIAAKASRDWRCDAVKAIGGSCPEEVTHADESIARAVLSALEKAGYRVVATEPTEEMVEAAGDLGNRNQNRLRYIPDALRAAHDAAPRYGEPSG